MHHILFADHQLFSGFLPRLLKERVCGFLLLLTAPEYFLYLKGTGLLHIALILLLTEDTLLQILTGVPRAPPVFPALIICHLPAPDWPAHLLTFSGQWIYVSYILQCLQPRQKVHGDLPVCRLISCRSVPVR